jgi:hypothetical protein
VHHGWNAVELQPTKEREKMNTLQSIIEGVLNRSCRLKVKRILSDINPVVYTPTSAVVKVKATKKAPRPPKERLWVHTVGGLMCCTPPEFEPAAYKGLKQNCGRPNKHEVKTTRSNKK